MDSKEERVYKRFDVKFLARYRIPGSPDVWSANIINFGAEGFCLLLERPLELNSEIDIAIQPPTGEEIVIRVKIMWMEFLKDSSRFKFGVKITEFTKDNEERFMKLYCQKLFQGLIETN